MIVFSASAELLRLTTTLGLAMPFVAGLWGVRTLFLGFTRSRRYAAGVSQGRAGVFPAPADRGMGCLLHGGHAAHDHLALDAPFGLTDASAATAQLRRLWP